MSSISKVNNLSRLPLAAQGEATPQNTLGSSRTLCGCLCMAVAFFFSPKKEPNVPGTPKLCDTGVVTIAFRERHVILQRGIGTEGLGLLNGVARKTSPLNEEAWTGAV